MSRSGQMTARPIVVWENTKEDGEREATVQELHTGGANNPNMPVIRIVSSGFGAKQAVKANAKAAGSLRCAA